MNPLWIRRGSHHVYFSKCELTRNNAFGMIYAVKHLIFAASKFGSFQRQGYI